MEEQNTAQRIVASGFDIEGYEDVKSAPYTVRSPDTGAPTACVFELAGPEHDLRRADSLNRQRRMRNEVMKTGKVQLDDPVEEEQELVAQMVRYTLGWTGLVIGGVEVKYSPDAARSLYADTKRHWLRDQIKAALDDRERFIVRCATA